MLLELRVRNLGVIEELSLLLGPGMTTVTGETGAGKTLVVEAIELLVGGRADSTMVRAGADEAIVEGRFLTSDGDEVIVGRVIPATGRSRAYVDGRMAPLASLEALGADLVDIHGQHAHQSLLSPAVQRRALDQFGGVDRSALDDARSRVRAADEALAGLGGDARSRAREIDLLRFQVAELDAAGVDDPDEEAALEAREDVLASAQAWRGAAITAYESLQGEGGAADALGSAIGALRGRSRSPFEEVASRLGAALVEVGDAASDLLTVAEGISDDPELLANVQDRRHLLRELRRKYGEDLADVIAFRAGARDRLEELASYEERVAELEAARAVAEAEVRVAAEAVARARRAAAPDLGRAIESHLRSLALPAGRFDVTVDGPAPGDEVVFGFSANAGEPVLPLAKVASGGELARTMLAARLVLTAGPPTLVFDEVDAGIGGEAAVAVGRSLASIGAEQVLVVTHLAQVAAFADAHVVVTKEVVGERTVARAGAVSGEERVREISRMLSGRADSVSAREHAAEMLAAGERTPARRPR